MHEQHGKNQYYVQPRTLGGIFGIRHYAGEVPYKIDGFLDKNRDAIQDEIYDLFGTSKDEVLVKIFTREAVPASQAAGQKKIFTAGSNFKAQLTTLVTTLASTTPHYVRCVKPNWEKKAFVFDPELVIGMSQKNSANFNVR